MARSISPTYDIHALYKKISSLANRSTWISYAMEFKKIFNMTPSSDIFQYHADLMQQVKLVKAQGECLGLNQVNVLPPWMEQCLLLMAAWQTPQYHKIALEFTMDDKAVTVETLVSELEKQRLLTAHLNQAGTGFARPTRQVDVRLSATPTQEQKLCYAFQKGKCHREGCPFLHEKGPEGPKKTFVREKDKVTPKSLPKTNAEAKKKKGPKSCYRCGSEAHLAPECKFEGKCDYCKKDGHKQSVCRKKTSDNVHVKVAEEVSIRLTCVEDDEQPSSQWNSIPDPQPIFWDLQSTTHSAQDQPREEIVIPDSGTDSEPPEAEIAVSAQMLRAEDSDDEKKEVIDLTPLLQAREPEANYREQRFLQKLNKIEHRRRFKLQKRRLYYTSESSLTRWWRRRMIELQGYLEENRDELFREYDAIVQQFLTRYGMHQTLHGVSGLLSASAYEHYEALLQTVDGSGLANVLVTRDKQARNET